MTDVSEATNGDTRDGNGPAAGAGGSTADKLKGQFETLRGQAGEKARDMAGQGKEKATGALDDAARFLEETARTIEEKVGPQYGRYAHSAAEGVSGFAEQLRSKEVDDLLEDARELVRKSPAVAIGAAVAVGFVLARLVKAGVSHDDTARTGATGGTDSAPPSPPAALGSGTATAPATGGPAAGTTGGPAATFPA
jgi:ElaB/YqjD/DUF883 family membrane-anchored ribosome-binding protein